MLDFVLNVHHYPLGNWLKYSVSLPLSQIIYLSRKDCSTCNKIIRLRASYTRLILFIIKFLVFSILFQLFCLILALPQLRHRNNSCHFCMSYLPYCIFFPLISQQHSVLSMVLSLWKCFFFFLFLSLVNF